ncbi:MAG: GTPase HflX [Rhodospirillaceae bacterium]|nr:GTPase HflX [Rhodospirillaceae bacterium]
MALDIADARLAPCRRIAPATWIGKGAVERIAHEVAEAHLELVVMDCTLSPGQQRNLERRWQCKVIDRTALILEIFGARAQTSEGRLQVEFAHLIWQRSRLVRSWTHLERQRGGFGFTGGPGEAQIELDRRLIDERIAKLKRQLEKVRQRRVLQRKAREKTPYPVAVLVGYTNAGKSSLFNRLASATVRAEDMLFATLDPTMRKISLPRGREMILSDTVGFISDLPTELVAAFRATLEEVTRADVVLHVRDVARSDSKSQAESVQDILSDLLSNEDLEERVIEIWNKTDLLDRADRERLNNQAVRSDARVVPVSAMTGEGIKALVAKVESLVGKDRKRLSVTIAYDQGAALNWLYERGAIVARHDAAESIELIVEVEQRDVQTLRRRFDLEIAPSIASTMNVPNFDNRNGNWAS